MTREVCEAHAPEKPCGPVVGYDADDVPYCRRCLNAALADYAQRPNCGTCHGRAQLLGGHPCPDCTDGKDWRAEAPDA